MQSYIELSEEDIVVLKTVGLEFISFIKLDKSFFHLKDSKLRIKAIKPKGCKARMSYYLSMKIKAMKLTSKGYLKEKKICMNRENFHSELIYRKYRKKYADSS